MLSPSHAASSATGVTSLAACPACGAGTDAPLLRRAGVPVHQNLLCTTRAEARDVARGDLALSACARCGLVFNAAFDVRRLAYTAAYDSDQSHSAAFLRHVDERIDALLEGGLRGATVAEAGCGSGYFLRRLCARGACRGWGFDPGYRGAARDSAGAEFVRAIFEGARSLPPGVHVDAVICRHVIEHVPAPAAFVRALAQGLSAGTRVYIETPALEWIEAHDALWDVFYEHCNYFSSEALTRVLEIGGLRVAAVTRTFGGQYLWAEARLDGAPPALTPPPGDPRAALRDFTRRCDAAQARLRAQVERLAAAGRPAVWGAAAKGATFASLVDPDGVRLSCLVDVNPARQGRFVAGTGHAIVAPDEIGALGITDAIVMNPNYHDEVRARVEQLGARVRLHLPGET